MDAFSIAVSIGAAVRRATGDVFPEVHQSALRAGRHVQSIQDRGTVVDSPLPMTCKSMSGGQMLDVRRVREHLRLRLSGPSADVQRAYTFNLLTVLVTCLPRFSRKTISPNSRCDQPSSLSVRGSEAKMAAVAASSSERTSKS